MDTAFPALTHALRDTLATTPLKTRRLVMRTPRVGDGRLIFEGYASDLEAIHWMDFRPHANIAKTDRVVASWIANWELCHGMLAFVIEHAVDHRFLGVIDITIESHRAAIGYILCRHAWGAGFATEAAQCIIDLAFEHFRVWRVWATCAPQNSVSRRVLEKLGMRHEGVLRRWVVSPLISPEPRDSDCLALTRDEWLMGRD